ncbi:MAG: ribonuclease HII [Candidatus Marinimicrobia bacterium]|nr:ribonuclease HII [Candidatus Neomarinimicrobiota bacterium]
MEIIAGVDEAGRGPLAGPVTAAAVILPENHSIKGLTDSKKLSAKQREQLFDEINKNAMSVGVGIVDVKEIDKINILQATYKAMYKALGALNPKPDKALVDGFALPNQIIPNEGIIKGDDKVDCIRAASIIAKVTRDRIMEQYDIIFPEYGFAKHKGYGTKLHLEKLREHKASLIHRKSFKPVSENLPTITWLQKNRKIGQWGEQLAAMEYYKNGYKIHALNHHSAPYGEIDIIAEKDDEIVFAEVKTAAGKTFGGIENQVDEVKLQRLSNAIDKYIMDFEIEKDIRLDVYAIRLGKNGPKLKHFKAIELE